MQEPQEPNAPRYYALTEEVINEVLNHLNAHPTVNLFNKVKNAALVTPAGKAEPVKETTPTT